MPILEFSFKILAVLATIPFIILGLAIFLMEESYQNFQERELNEFNTITSIQKEKISSDFNYLFNVVETYPALPEWRTLPSIEKIEQKNGGISEFDELSKRQAAKFLISNVGFQSFGITLTDGRMYFLEPFDHQSNLSKMNFSDREWFQGVLKNEDTYVSDVFISDATGHPIIVISTPVFSKDGQIIGMWGGSLDIEYLTKFFENIKKKNSATVLIDQKNITIADTRNENFHEKFSDNSIINVMDGRINDSGYINFDKTYFFIDDIKIGNKNWKLINMISEENLIPQLSVQRNNNYILIIMMGIFIIVSEYLLFSFLKKNFQLNADILENRKMLIKHERLVAIGELASRVAHDIRNPLSNIRMASKLIENIPFQSTDNEAIKEKLTIINKNIQRIEHQINDVLQYVRTKRINRQRIFLNTCIEESINLLHIPENITVKIEKSNLTIFVDPIQLQVVFNNILINAIQAIGKQKGEIRIESFEELEFTIIKIENSGPPIPEEVLPNIFEALTTTKEIGTGLGLASCRRIVENHGGVIDVKNNPTTFIIKLPKS